MKIYKGKVDWTDSFSGAVLIAAEKISIVKF